MFSSQCQEFAAQNARGKFQGTKDGFRFPERLRFGFPEEVSLSQGFVVGSPTLPKESIARNNALVDKNRE